MKKILSLALAAVLAAGLCACGQGAAASAASESAAVSAQETPAPTEAPAETAAEPAEEAATPAPEASAEAQAQESGAGGRVLVAYFSATNTTEGIAVQLADGLGADLYEITPEQPYTEEDLDYGDDASRTTQEMNDPAARPAIAGAVEDMAQYDVVFLGYPIWWGDAPRIVSTFLESYDFSGKTVVPFCTSGSSGIAASAANLQQLAPDAVWLEGSRFAADATQDEILAWADALGLAPEN